MGLGTLLGLLVPQHFCMLLVLLFQSGSGSQEVLECGVRGKK